MFRISVVILASAVSMLVQSSTELCPTQCCCANRTITCTNANITNGTLLMNAFKNGITSINLQNNSISDLSFLRAGNKLTKINLSFNNISDIPIKTFLESKQITHLNMSHNALTHVTAQSLTPLQSLQTLDLSHNDLLGPSAGAFQALPSLTTLLLGYNGELGSGLRAIVAISRVLRELDLTTSGLSHVPEALTQSVRVLKIGNNSIQEILDGDFDSYPLLQLLDLSHNLIIYIQDDALGRLDLLTHLDMTGNHLHQVPDHLPTSLTGLHLARNQIQSLNIEALSSLPALESLDLSNNLFRLLPATLNLGELKMLKLKDNHLRTFGENFLLNFPHLEVLYAAGNDLQCDELTWLSTKLILIDFFQMNQMNCTTKNDVLITNIPDIMYRNYDKNKDLSNSQVALNTTNDILKLNDTKTEIITNKNVKDSLQVHKENKLKSYKNNSSWIQNTMNGKGTVENRTSLKQNINEEHHSGNNKIIPDTLTLNETAGDSHDMKNKTGEIIAKNKSQIKVTEPKSENNKSTNITLTNNAMASDKMAKHSSGVMVTTAPFKKIDKFLENNTGSNQKVTEIVSNNNRNFKNVVNLKILSGRVANDFENSKISVSKYKYNNSEIIRIRPTLQTNLTNAQRVGKTVMKHSRIVNIAKQAENNTNESKKGNESEDVTKREMTSPSYETLLPPNRTAQDVGTSADNFTNKTRSENNTEQYVKNITKPKSSATRGRADNVLINNETFPTNENATLQAAMLIENVPALPTRGHPGLLAVFGCCIFILGAIGVVKLFKSRPENNRDLRPDRENYNLDLLTFNDDFW